MFKIKGHGIAFEGGATFDAGSKIKGHVFIQLEESLKVRGIKLLFVGLAEVKWTEMKRIGFQINQASEKYFNHSILIYRNRPNQEMLPGLHKFPFVFQLPRLLPASYESEYGHVRYYVKSKIDHPWTFDLTTTTTRFFKIRPKKDLNLDPDNRLGLCAEKGKNLGCLCCKSGPISATFEILQRGFVPGEAIEIYTEISNDSDRIIDSFFVNLKRTTTVFARGNGKCQTSEIASVTGPAVRPHHKDGWRGQPLIVPSTPPSGLPGCGIIDIQYWLKLKVEPAGLGYALEIPFEINIGTIPLRQQQQGRAQSRVLHRNFEESLVNFAAQTSTVPSYSSTASSTYAIATAPPEEDEQGPEELTKKGGYQRLP